MAEKSFLDLKVKFASEKDFSEFLDDLYEHGFTVGNIKVLYFIGDSSVRAVELGSPFPYEETVSWLEERFGERREKSKSSIQILEITDSLLSWHSGGKIVVELKAPFGGFLDLRKIYTPGVAEISRKIEKDKSLSWKLTWRGSTAVVFSDGSAVLGLGDVGPEAALPVMEGKAALIRLLGGVNAVPLVVKEKDPDRLVDIIASVSPSYGVIQLEDVSAPRCFYIIDKLRSLQKKGELDTPFFHDDQHGTAAVVLSAVLKALEISGKKDRDYYRVVVLGAGAASNAVVKLLFYWAEKFGVSLDVKVFDSKGILFPDREDMDKYKRQLAFITNPENLKLSLEEAFRGADIFIGLSRPGLVKKEHIESMAESPIVLSLANPQPEISPEEARQAGASVAADGRTVNNALVFPGLIRGVLLGGVRVIDNEVLLRAAQAVFESSGDELVPSQLDLDVHRKVASEVGELTEN